MAGKTLKNKNTTTEADEFEDDIVESGDEVERDSRPSAASDALDDVVAQLGGSSSANVLLKVYRKDPKNGRVEFVLNARPEDLPLEERLRDEYGGGEFEVRLYLPNEGSARGGASIHKIVPLKIAQRLAPPKSEQSAFNIERVLEKMGEQNAAMIKNISESLALRMENMVLKSGAGQQGMGVKDMLEIFSLFKQLSPQSKASSLPEMLQEVAALKDVMPDLFGGGNGMTGWDAALKGITALTSAIQAQQRGGAVGASVPEEDWMGEEVRARQQIAAADGVTDGDGDDMMKILIRNKLQALCKQAAAERDPAVYAMVLLDEVPEVYYDKLLEFLGDNDAVAIAQLIGAYPGVADYRPWFAAFCAVIREELTPPDLTDPPAGVISTSTDQGNDKPDAADNVAAPGGGDSGNSTSHS